MSGATLIDRTEDPSMLTTKMARCRSTGPFSLGVLLCSQRDRCCSLRAYIVHEQGDEIAALEAGYRVLQVRRRADLALLWIQHADDDRAVLIQLVIRWPARRDIRD